MFLGLLILKANKKRVRKILVKEGFIYTEDDILKILAGNQKGQRYGSAILLRREGGKETKRFIKVLLDGKWKTYKPFRRQVKIAEALDADKSYDDHTLSVLNYSLKPIVPYAIFETREDGDGYGFMDDEPRYYKNVSENDIARLVNIMYSFHLAGLQIDSQTMEYTVNLKTNLNQYKKQLNKSLDKKIEHKTASGEVVHSSVESIIETYYALPNIREKILKKFEENWKVTEKYISEEGAFLVHADMQIDNVYRHKDGSFELLDFEWVGRSTNPGIAIMYDYGNLRARGWSSPEFQKNLDVAMIEVGKKYHKDRTFIEASLVLGKIRSALEIARYHLDYVNTTRNDKRSDELYHQMYPKTLDSLREVLNN